LLAHPPSQFLQEALSYRQALRRTKIVDMRQWRSGGHR
jgi:hypothetical protein